MMPFLEVKDMRKQYGAIKAVDGVSMKVGPGEIVGVIGPNGSGKTTLFNSILGQIQPTSGNVEFCGENITGMSPLELSRRGVGRTFQTLQVFVKLSVRDNLIAAAQEFKGTLGSRLFTKENVDAGGEELVSGAGHDSGPRMWFGRKVQEWPESPSLARAEFVSSVAWWRDCSKSRLPLASASRSS